MAKDTRALLLDTAEALFAERGFYGVSIAAVADELGLTKQALLHHFGSKEKLYGEVLRRISGRFEGVTDKAEVMSGEATPALKAFFLALYQASVERPDQTRLLMRELLDNQHRADSAGAWHLKPFLERLIAMIKAAPDWRSASEAEALAVGYQILGAINYFSVSQPTLTGIFGAGAYANLERAYPKQLERLIEAALRMGPTA